MIIIRTNKFYQCNRHLEQSSSNFIFWWFFIFLLHNTRPSLCLSLTYVDVLYYIRNWIESKSSFWVFDGNYCYLYSLSACRHSWNRVRIHTSASASPALYRFKCAPSNVYQFRNPFCLVGGIFWLCFHRHFHFHSHFQHFLLLNFTDMTFNHYHCRCASLPVACVSLCLSIARRSFALSQTALALRV